MTRDALATESTELSPHADSQRLRERRRDRVGTGGAERDALDPLTFHGNDERIDVDSLRLSALL